jgi:hypothetical protein
MQRCYHIGNGGMGESGWIESPEFTILMLSVKHH